MQAKGFCGDQDKMERDTEEILKALRDFIDVALVILMLLLFLLLCTDKQR